MDRDAPVLFPVRARDRMTALARAPEVLARVMAAQDELDAALADRDRLLRDVRAEGIPRRRVGGLVREALRRAGWDESRVWAARVSDGNVDRILGSK